MIRSNVLNSGEIVTEFTLNAERQTMCLTGIDIDTDITKKNTSYILIRNSHNVVISSLRDLN